MKTKEQKLALLDETAAAYTSATRCTTHSGSCQYFIEGKIGCAIGRLIKDKELCRGLDNGDYAGGYTSVANSDVFSLLPADLKDYGQQLLVSLQNLHDDEPNWDTDGLSDAGKIKVLNIRSEIECGVI